MDRHYKEVLDTLQIFQSTFTFIVLLLATGYTMCALKFRLDRAALVCMTAYLGNLMVKMLMALSRTFQVSVAYPVNIALHTVIWCSLIFFTFDINKVKVKLSL